MLLFRIIIHGFGQNGRSPINRDLKNGFLARGDYNVIVTDWSALSGPQYQYGRYNVNPAGLSVAAFISWMNMNYNTLQVVGYDLGAHVAGIAGRNTVNGRVTKIIG